MVYLDGRGLGDMVGAGLRFGVRGEVGSGSVLVWSWVRLRLDFWGLRVKF